ncbi:MAG: hypothetical protein V1858_01680 [Candidatus Gottesmanbacteria bacterium]
MSSGEGAMIKEQSIFSVNPEFSKRMGDLSTWIAQQADRGKKEFWKSVEISIKQPPQVLLNFIKEIDRDPYTSARELEKQGLNKQISSDLITVLQSNAKPSGMIEEDIKAAKRLITTVEEKAKVPIGILQVIRNGVDKESTARVAGDLLSRRNVLRFPGSPSGKKPGDKDRKEEEDIKRSRAWIPEVGCLVLLLSCCFCGRNSIDFLSRSINFLREGRAEIFDPDLSRVLKVQRNLVDQGKDPGSSLINIYSGSRLEMQGIIKNKEQDNVFDGLIIPDYFNPEDNFSAEEICRASGWTQALREEYFVNGIFQINIFFNAMKNKGYTKDSISRFLEKYSIFLDEYEIGAEPHSKIPPKYLPSSAKGTGVFKELKRSSYGAFGKTRAKEIRSQRRV